MPMGAVLRAGGLYPRRRGEAQACHRLARAHGRLSPASRDLFSGFSSSFFGMFAPDLRAQRDPVGWGAQRLHAQAARRPMCSQF